MLDDAVAARSAISSHPQVVIVILREVGLGASRRLPMSTFPTNSRGEKIDMSSGACLPA